MKILTFSAIASLFLFSFSACGGDKPNPNPNQVIKIDSSQSNRTNETAKAEEEAMQKAEMQKAVSESAAKTCDCKGVKEYLKFTVKLAKATDAQKQAAASKMTALGKIFASCTNSTAQLVQQQFPTRKDVTETFNNEVTKLCTVVSK